MKVLDLTKTSKLRVVNEIRSTCGGYSVEGRWLSGFGKGLGGFTFKDPQSSNDGADFKCNIEFYKNGMGIYFRNIYSNYLILLHDSEIISIEIVKLADTIKPVVWSLYNILTKSGVSPVKASKYLMPKEIITEYSAFCNIKLSDIYFKLDMVNLSVEKIERIFLKSKFAHLLTLNVEQPKVIYQSDNIFHN